MSSSLFWKIVSNGLLNSQSDFLINSDKVFIQAVKQLSVFFFIVVCFFVCLFKINLWNIEFSCFSYRPEREKEVNRGALS